MRRALLHVGVAMGLPGLLLAVLVFLLFVVRWEMAWDGLIWVGRQLDANYVPVPDWLRELNRWLGCKDC
jgi:hypothetical protein